MKKILVLGGTGAMGVHLVDYLAKSNHYDIYVTSRNNRKSDLVNVHFIQGNARDYNFIKNVCENKYDVIVDFMNYNLDEFKLNYTTLLNSTDHYLFLSSCRVYSNEKKLNENSKRLLDISNDTEFLATNRYALRKAREENILKESNMSNFSIIRPYITYCNIRLQLGIYEKECWLYRFLNNKPLVINKNILDKKTTLTHASDVSKLIFQIIEIINPSGDVYQITTEESITWGEVLEIYIDILKEKLGINPIIYLLDDLENIEVLSEGGYNTKYDRLWNREFKSNKLTKILGNYSYIPVRDGLKSSLEEFLDMYNKIGDSVFNDIDKNLDSLMDIEAKKCKKYLKELII